MHNKWIIYPKNNPNCFSAGHFSSSSSEESDDDICEASTNINSTIRGHGQDRSAGRPTSGSNVEEPEVNHNVPEINSNTGLTEIWLPTSGLNTAKNINKTRKRRTPSNVIKQIKLQRKQKKMMSYCVKLGCDERCSKKCSRKFAEDERAEINKKYWKLSWLERREFIRSMTVVAVPKRQVTQRKKAPRKAFNLRNSDGVIVEVCKIFFLTTLGFKKSNDRILYNSLKKSNDKDRRGLHIKTPPFNRQLITEHVKSFHLLEQHQTGDDGAPARAVPRDLTIKFMHNDFCEKNPSRKIGYQIYRQHVKTMLNLAWQ